jgi:hypothetical protein
MRPTRTLKYNLRSIGCGCATLLIAVVVLAVGLAIAVGLFLRIVQTILGA